MANVIIDNKRLIIDESTPSLVKLLKDGFQTAVDHRKSSGIDKRLVDDLRQATSVYDPCLKETFTQAGEPDVYFPLGAMKARAQTSLVRDTVAGAIEKMWDATPTPVPELPKSVSDSIRDQVFAELGDLVGTGAVFNFEELIKIVNNLVDEQVDREFQEAKERSDRMSKYILDQWVEGGWIDTWSECISDLGRSKVAIAKGPVDVMRRTVTWSGNSLKESYEAEPIMYRVAPQNFYPMPDVSHDVQTGTGIYELGTMTLAELHEASCMKGYNQEMLLDLISANPNGWYREDLVDDEISQILNNSDDPKSQDAKAGLGAGLFHTIKYYGRVQVSELREDKAISEIPKSLKDTDFVSIEAWFIKDSIIYLNLEPYPLGERPFSVIPREFIAGSIWGGESLQSMISVPARVINALVRQQILNMGYAAGPIGEAESARFPKGVPDYVEPRKIYTVNASTHGEKAMRFTDITPHTDLYMRTITFWLNQADSLSGIPSFIEGSPGGERNATLGHTQFYFGNATRGIDTLLMTVDRFLIEPMLKRFYYRNLTRVNDDSIKGDAKWKARGLAGVFQKQGKRDQSIAAIQLLAQLRQIMPSYVTEESFLKLVAPVFENIGLDIDEVLINNNANSGTGTEPPLPTSQTSQVADVVNTLNQTATETDVVTSTQ